MIIRNARGQSTLAKGKLETARQLSVYADTTKKIPSHEESLSVITIT